MSMCTSADCKLCEFLSSKEDLETSFNRVETQKAKCKFGKEGVCCKLCSNGPCKITPKSPKGVCGADADTIVSRNFKSDSSRFRMLPSRSGNYSKKTLKTLVKEKVI